MQDKILFYMMIDYLDHLSIPHRQLQEPYQWKSEFDFQLRAQLNLPFASFDQLFSHPKELCLFQDIFDCHYLTLAHPEGGFLMAGPYLTQSPRWEHMQHLLLRLGIDHPRRANFSPLYDQIPMITGNTEFEAFLTSFSYAYLLRNLRREQLDEDKRLADMGYQSPQESTRDQLSFRLLEERYALEEEGLSAMREGNAKKAEEAFSDQFFYRMEIRTKSPLRSHKNYLIVANTLFRKAAQEAGVHPYYLNEISRKFSIRIENLQEISHSGDLLHQMVHQYCNLIQTHRAGNYPELVQKSINYIGAHLDGNLHLSLIADHFNVNKSYLSSLFKKEVGETVSAYIRRCRMERAIYLLNTTHLSVQEIANACGVSDLSYFIKLFHRQKGISPHQYRKMLLR